MVTNGVVLLGGERKERRLVVVVLMKVATLWWRELGSMEEAMFDGRVTVQEKNFVRESRYSFGFTGRRINEKTI